ncbi:hypothetical protein MPSEU_000092200 [Mayamaea pseudoterrestris]|nr:hypothetical protein MPSEU_000092200 [Mayamaea pseudoterrestris]
MLCNDEASDSVPKSSEENEENKIALACITDVNGESQSHEDDADDDAAVAVASTPPSSPDKVPAKMPASVIVVSLPTTLPGARYVYPNRYDLNAEPSQEIVYDAALVHAGIPPEGAAASLNIDEGTRTPVLLGTVAYSGVPASSDEYPVVLATLVEGVHIKRRRFMCIVFGLILVLCIIGISAGMSVETKRPIDAPLGTPFELPSTISRFALILPSYTQKTLQSELPVDIRRENDRIQAKVWANDSFLPVTPQGKAWKWLVSDPNSQSRTLGEVTLRFALATLYYATDGPNWTNNSNWLSTKDVCEWHISSDALYDNTKFESAAEHCLEIGFYQLYLQSNNLVGTLPPELALAPSYFIKLSQNSLHGSIHEDVWSSWRDLRSLHLFSNNFSGTISSSVGLMTNLQIFRIQANHISGSLPLDMGNMAALIEFLASENDIKGRIPPQLERPSALQILDISDNALTGQLPSEIFKNLSLKQLYLTMNRLTVSIPSNIGSCKLLESIQLGYNLLTGSIPSEVGGLSYLKALYLNNNFLVGTLSSHLAGLSVLYSLDVSGTSVSGTIPSELSVLSQIRKLQVFDTILSGSVPEKMCQAFSLRNANDGIVVDCDQVRCDCNCTCG